MSLAKQWNEERKARLARLGMTVPAAPRIHEDIERRLRDEVEQQKLTIAKLQSTISDQEEKIRRLKEDAEVAMPLIALVKHHGESLPEDVIGSSMAAVQLACCRYFEVSRIDMVSPRRTAPLAYARQIAMYLCREHTVRSFSEIGRHFGRRDHSTVLHAAKKIAELVRKDWVVAYDVAHVELTI